MLSAITFDTFEFINTLISTGFTDKQAQTMSDLQRKTVEHILNGQLATKEDLNKEIRSVRDEVHSVKDELKKDFHRLEKEVIKIDNKLDQAIIQFNGKFNLLHWMFGFILAVLLSIFAKLFV